MKTVYGLNSLKKQSSQAVVTVGVFDGVHIGHQKIIKELIKKARKLKAKPVVVTFDPHPDKVLKGYSSVAMLASLKHRTHLLQEFGVELCVVTRFDRSFAKKNAIDFIEKSLINKLKMKMLILGENFSFGKERLQDAKALGKIANDLNFKLKVIKSKKHNSRTISSSLIRHLIENGKLKQASRLLARPVSILGTVVKGRQRGRDIGFRTANIDPHHEAIPPSGVYACYSKLNKRIYKSVLNIGTRPTFDEEEPTIEVHLFNFNGYLYGKDIEINFIKRLRAERRFKDKARLSMQIQKDAQLSKKILK